MSEIVILNRDNFEAVTSREGVVVVDCWASWCPACKAFAPVYEAAAAQHPQHVFGKLDTQQERELTAALGVTHIPALLVYRDGLVLYHEAGSPAAEDLEDILRQAEAVDMGEVRRHLAAQAAAPE